MDIKRYIDYDEYLNTLLFSLVGAMGMVVMVGWFLGVEVLVRVLPELAPMQFNNALCFLLLGVGGFAYQFRYKWLLFGISVVGLLLSLITLLQYILKVDLRIDLLLMNTQDLVPTAHPGRMAPNSALGHILAFTSLILLSGKGTFRINLAAWLGAVVTGLGIISLAGYAINFDGGFNWGQYTQMALHTSVGFLLAGGALGVTIIPKKRYLERSRFQLWPYVIILLVTVFFIDLQIPQGVAVGLLYVVPLLASWYFKNRKHILVVAVLCTVSIIIDILLATEYLPQEAISYNRFMSITAVWIAALIFYFLKRVYEKQREADMKFKLAVEGTTAGLWDWISVNEEQEWWSSQFYHLLGYEDQEIPSTLGTFKDLLHPEDQELTFKMVDRHLNKKSPFVVEYRLKHKSGKYRWFLGSGKATWDDDGKPDRMVGTIIDIHARKMAEDAEQQRSAELESKNQELEQFIYVASHDLQEPVRTIRSFVDLFNMDYADQIKDEGKLYLKFIKEASQRSERLIIDLLDYGRIGKKQEMQMVDLNKVLDDVLVDLSVRINEANAQVLSERLPVVVGFPTDLRLLFQNLIGNAVKFRKMDVTPEVRVSVKKNPSEFEFAISDNGIGIAEKHLDAIFIIFRRLHGKTEYEGTGIGLAHCKKIVEQHGGQIWVSSVVGNGTTFYFTLPFTEEQL